MHKNEIMTKTIAWMLSSRATVKPELKRQYDESLTSKPAIDLKAELEE